MGGGVLGWSIAHLTTRRDRNSDSRTDRLPPMTNPYETPPPNSAASAVERDGESSVLNDMARSRKRLRLLVLVAYCAPLITFAVNVIFGSPARPSPENMAARQFGVIAALLLPALLLLVDRCWPIIILRLLSGLQMAFIAMVYLVVHDIARDVGLTAMLLASLIGFSVILVAYHYYKKQSW